MLISQYRSRTGKEKVLAITRRRGGEERKRCAKTPSRMCWVSERFQPKKKDRKDREVFVASPRIVV